MIADPSCGRRAVALLLAAALAAGCGGERGGAPGTDADAAAEIRVRPEAGDSVAIPTGEAIELAEVLDAGGADGDAVTEDGEFVRPTPPRPLTLPQDPPTFERPRHVRGIYLNAHTAGSAARLEQLIGLAHRTEVNAFVIDLKDVSGRVSYPSGVGAVLEVGASTRRIPDIVGLLRRLSEEGIYPIARIVIARDPFLTAARPDLAIQDRDGGVWADGRGEAWLDPYQRDVWEYHVELAREALRLGFPEIQWDYVRFPDGPLSRRRRAAYPGDGGPDPEIIRAFLQYARARLEEVNPDMAMTADVFGVTTTGRDVGIGQKWDRFIDVVHVALPMVYPSHYWTGGYGFEHPNAHPYEIVLAALRDAARSSEGIEGAGIVRPWLQDFDLGEPVYGPAESRAQIQATYDAGFHEWVFWNPGSRYTEGGFLPAGGLPDGEEPYMRVADRIVPVSARHRVLDQARRAAAEAREDSLEAARRAEERREDQPRVLDPDSLRRAIEQILGGQDTLRRDTLPPGTTRRPR